MSMPSLKNEKEILTYRDYRNWPDEERCELIQGVPYDMSPAPHPRHQRILLELGRQISNHLQDSECIPYIAPFDVRLPEKNEADDEIITVVQPDFSVVCDSSKVDDRGCRGAPDFIIEILSPSTAAKDQIRKLSLYEKHGVKEYWIIHPADNILYVRILGPDGRYGATEILEGGSKKTASIEGLVIDLDAVFGV